jgi:hypothetical protein
MADFRASRVGRLDSGSSGGNFVEVQVLSSAPIKSVSEFISGSEAHTVIRSLLAL